LDAPYRLDAQGHHTIRTPLCTPLVIRTIKHLDNNFIAELFNLFWIILLICQQHFSLNFFNGFVFFKQKNMFLNLFYSWSQRFLHQWFQFDNTLVTRITSITLLLYPWLGLALPEYKQWLTECVFRVIHFSWIYFPGEFIYILDVFSCWICSQVTWCQHWSDEHNKTEGKVSMVKHEWPQPWQLWWVTFCELL